MQQGDPFDPLLFSLTVHPIVERIELYTVSTDLNTNEWYLGEGLCGNSNNFVDGPENCGKQSPRERFIPNMSLEI